MGAQASKGPNITPHDRAILDLKLQRDKVKQYQKKLQVILDREHQLARDALARGDKDRARTALRRRKWQEGMISKTDTQLETLEGLVQNIEFSQIQASVVHGLKQGNAVLKEIHRELNPESVERLMEETADAVAYQREVDEMLASRMTREEEDEVQDELEALEREARREAGEVVDEPVKQPVKEVQLPTAPTEEPLAQVPATRIPEQSQEQVSEELREAILA